MHLRLRYFHVGDKKQDYNSIETDRNLVDRILKYTGVFGGVQCVSILMTFALTKVKSVLLGPVGYGITENLNRSADIVKNSTNLGIATVAVPDISQSAADQDYDKLSDKVMLTRSWALLTALAGMAVCLVLAPFLNVWAFGGEGSYTAGFMVLSLAVAASAVAGGETAILRGSGMLRQIALSQLFSGLFSLLISLPLYWFFRLEGIIPALVLVSIGNMAINLYFSVRRFPYTAHPFKWSHLRNGTGMIGFGIYFTIVAFMSALAWSFIARFLMDKGGAELTGTYSAGYMLVTYFTTLLLSVTDTEYYPRLSAVCNDLKEAHRLMNHQSLAMCMLSAPLVILFILLAPVAVYIALDYDKFHTSILLAQLASVGLFFKSVSQPIGYMLLSRSDSRIYLIQESLCYIMLVICVSVGFNYAGVLGLGASFAVWELSYLLLVLIVSRLRYGFRMTGTVVRNFIIQGVLVSAAAVGAVADTTAGVLLDVAVCVVSVVFSICFYWKNSTFIPSFFSKLFTRSGSR